MPEDRRDRPRAGCLEFTARTLDPDSGRVSLIWRLDRLELVETFDLGGPVVPSAAIDAALDALHWIAGVSYFKTTCPPRLAFPDSGPDAWQAEALDQIYREGLAEFAWHNRLDPATWPSFRPVAAGPPASAPVAADSSAGRCLVPMGGGKDSLVALERVRRVDPDAVTVQVGTAGLIGQVARVAGGEHRVIDRSLAPGLRTLNEAGAWNGHVPVTAIHSAVLTLAALAWGFDCVAFANERSADEPSLVTESGRPVNHQYSKSWGFESLWQEWVRRSVDPGLTVFSILRRDRELAVCREFAGLDRYHPVFSSCNRNFHLDGPRTERWCGACPKCLFVFLCMAPFLEPKRMVSIFGRDLLSEPERLEGFLSLLAVDGAKPFECVGEKAEAQAAVRHLAADPRWNSRPLVQQLDRALGGLAVPTLEALLAPGGPHAIPARFVDAT